MISRLRRTCDAYKYDDATFGEVKSAGKKWTPQMGEPGRAQLPVFDC